MLHPLLSEHDPKTTSEGTIDPLGLYSIADSLARLLCPGVRERQSRLRLLTAYAVSLHLCPKFDPEQIAADGVTEPWLVFEWYLVEGLVRRLPAAELVGVPGRDKTEAAVRAHAHLSAARYLKGPANFGFHGVYRVLARDLGVEVAGQLGHTGFALLSAWADDQGLEGFVQSADGEGRRLRSLLTDAVTAGLQAGEVDRTPGWQGWALLAEHLAPGRIGPGERSVLRGALEAPEAGHRRAVLAYLISDEGRARWLQAGSERDLHSGLRERSSAPLGALLDAISVYETFSRLCTDAFFACLHEMSQATGRVRPERLGASPPVAAAAQQVPSLLSELTQRLSPYGQEAALRERFCELFRPCDATAWSVALLDHHRRVQQGKPPAGKAPWCERFDDGSYMVRPAYRVGDTAGGTEEYVHAYRTGPLWRFARDLRLVS
jgi:hypothetical protein